MPHRNDKEYLCNTCGTPTRKLTDRGTRARCADCGTAEGVAANELMRQAVAKIRADLGLPEKPSTMDTEE